MIHFYCTVEEPLEKRRKRSLATKDDEMIEKIMNITDKVMIRKGMQHHYKVRPKDTDDDIDDDDDLDAESEDIAIEEDKESDAPVPTTESLERDEVKQKQIVDVVGNLGTNVTEQLEHPKSASFVENSNVTINATQNGTEKYQKSGELVVSTELSQYLLMFILLCLV